jgi:hypothetical protein
MDWIQFLIAIIIFGGCFLWSGMESRAHIRLFEARIGRRMDTLIRMLHNEMKDFQNRLQGIEQKHKSKKL